MAPRNKTTDAEVVTTATEETAAPKKTTTRKTTAAKTTKSSTTKATATKKTATTRKTTAKKATEEKLASTPVATEKPAAPAKAVQKVFKIERVATRVRMQINDSNFWLDDTECDRLAMCLNCAMNPADIQYPIKGHSTYITYSNGINAAILTVCKLDKDATNFMFTVVYMKPDMSTYNADSFFVTKAVMDKYMNALVPDVLEKIAQGE